MKIIWKLSTKNPNKPKPMKPKKAWGHYSWVLRENPTKAEKQLWNQLSKLPGYCFQQMIQTPLGLYIVDFLHLWSKTVIEVDGKHHETPKRKALDNLRTKRLEKQGYRVYRYKNEEIFKNLKEVVISIEQVVALC